MAGLLHPTSSRLALAAVAAVAGLAACGGQDHLTHEQLVARANAYCQGANAQVEKLPPTPQTLVGVARYAAEFAPIARRLGSRLDSLDPPDADRAAFDGYRRAFRRNVRQLDALRRAALGGDADAVGRVADAIAKQPTDGDAMRLGLVSCAQHPTPGAA